MSEQSSEIEIAMARCMEVVSKLIADELLNPMDDYSRGRYEGLLEARRGLGDLVAKETRS